MKYISLDTETTGLNKERCQVIQIAVVVDDLVTPIEQLPRFVANVKWDNLRFEPFALQMHVKSGLMEQYLADKDKKYFRQTILALTSFLEEHYPLKEKQKYTVAGKNVASFDIPFLKSNMIEAGLEGFRFIDSYQKEPEKTILDSFSHRVIDPGTFYTNLFFDTAVADLSTCKRRAGISDTEVSHFALDDALDVVKVVRDIAHSNKLLRP